MKTCPQCNKSYPDTESFCQTDGSKLNPAGTARAGAGGQSGPATKSWSLGQGAAPVECPVCGGKAEPGEAICNFCGTRLVPEGAAPSAKTPPSPAAGAKRTTMVEQQPPVQSRTRNVG